MNIEPSIRQSIESDLDVFFLNQTDEQASFMAAFTPENPNDREAYLSKWQKLMKNDTINMQTILIEDKVIGCVVKFEMEGEAEITYALAKEYWGKGVTTKAVNTFLNIEQIRPIYGHVAFDNFGSQRILEKVGFKKIGKEKGFANARGKEIEEFVYRID